MPCSSGGFPPSPCYGDTLPHSDSIKTRIESMEKELEIRHIRTKELENKIKLMKEAYKIMGNGG